MRKSARRICSLALALLLTCSLLPVPAAAAPSIEGTWETVFTLPAGDFGVSAPDIRLKCTLEFRPDGTVSATWKAEELTAIRLYFHQLFVSAYYACAYGAGITSFEAVEAFCLNSTGKTVSDYMFAFLDSFDMYAIFTPAPAKGRYRMYQNGQKLCWDLPLMDQASDGNVENPCILENGTMVINAVSHGKPGYMLHCQRKGGTSNQPPTTPPETEPAETTPPETQKPVPPSEPAETIKVSSNKTIHIPQGSTVKLKCTYNESESYRIYNWALESGTGVISIDAAYNTCTVTALHPGEAQISMKYEYTYKGPDVLTGIERTKFASKNRTYTIIVE